MADLTVPGGSATPDNPKGAAGRPAHTSQPSDFEPALEPGEEPRETEPVEEEVHAPPVDRDELTSAPGPALDQPLGRISRPTKEQAQEDQELNERYHTLNPLRPEYLERASAAIQETPGLAPLARGVQAIADAAQGRSEPSQAAEPGYNFLDYIPPGFLQDYGHEYINTENRAQAAEVTARIRERMANQAVLARSGWTGQAAVFAAGAVDPLNLAAMALIPEAAATRFGNAVRWALTNAAATGAQELVRASEDPSATLRGGLINVSASAVLGGLLGPLAPRVPKSTLERIADDLHGELYPPSIPEPAATSHSIDMDGIHTVRSENGVTTAKERGDNTLQILTTETAEGARGRGENPARIARMADEAADRGLTLTSDTKVATHAAKAYDRLGDGYEVTRNPAEPDGEGNLVSTAGRPVFEVRPKEPPSVLGSALRGVSDELDSHVAGLEEASFKDGYIPTPEEPSEIEVERESRIQAARGAEKEAAVAEIPPEAEHALPGEPMYVNPEMESTAGAMAVHGGRLADMDVARGGKLYSKTVGRVSVAARLMESESPAVRRLTMELMNLPGTLEGHFRDIASPNPIERILWQEVDAKQAAAIAKMNEQFGAYRARMKQEGLQALDRTQFEEQWARAMRRGDKSAIPEVSAMSRWQRENILNPFWERAKKAGIAPEEGQLFADSYLTRLYDIPKIRANKEGWLKLLQGAFMKQGVEDSLEARTIAHDVDRNITSGEKNTMDWHALDGIVPKSGRLKERKLFLADSTLEPFLSSNHSELTRSYLHSMVPEVNMVERFGTRDLSDQFQNIRDEYTHLIELAQGNNARIRELEKARDSNLQLLSAARDQLYGIYGVPRDPANFFIRAGRDLRALNVGRMLGGATFKHFPDVANVIQRYGAPQTMAVMAKLATSLDAIKMGYREAKRMGAAIDMVMNVSASRLWDAPAHSTFMEQRALNKFNRFFTIATLETPLITAMQSIASVAGQDEILRMAERVAGGQVLPKNRAAVLAAAGLDTGMLERIAAANAQHGRQINGLKFGMSEQWADKQAAQAFESAVIRDAHGVTMRPGIGDKPLFMAKEWGKFVFQFKSFEFAASRIVGLPMLQGLAHGDARAAQALLAQFALATMGYVAYQKATGGKVEVDPKKLVVELLDRTNLLGWTGSAIFPALYGLGFKDLSRWYDKDPMSALGPSAELGKEILDRQLLGRLEQGVAGAAPGQHPLAMRRSDLHFVRKMAPANQLWYGRRAVDNLEDMIGDTFNLPGESRAEIREKDESRGSPTIQ